MNLIPCRNKSQAPVRKSEASHSQGTLRAEFDRLWEQFLDAPWGTSLGSVLGGVLPRIDITETDAALTVRAEVPGLTASDVQIEITSNQLSLSGEKRKEREEVRGEVHCSECEFGSFRRSVPLPPGIDTEQVSATCQEGVLTIVLPKRPDARKQLVKVRTA